MFSKNMLYRLRERISSREMFAVSRFKHHRMMQQRAELVAAFLTHFQQRQYSPPVGFSEKIHKPSFVVIHRLARGSAQAA